MTSLLKKLKDNRKAIYQIAEKYGVSNIRVFGSVAKEKENSKSDVDLLVDIDFTKLKSGFAFFTFENELTKKFHRNFEITTINSLKIKNKNKIVKESIKL